MIAPIETKSTPVSATARSVAAFTLPEASSSWRLPVCASRSFDGRAHVVEREVVEHDAVGVGRERLAQLVERLDLDLDHDVRRLAARRGDGRSHAADGGDVILFDEHRVEEADAVILAAAAAHGILLREP